MLDSAIPSLLQGADIKLLRFPGGSTADNYDWQNNTVSGNTQSVDFAQFSSVATAAGAQKLITVNYGSGTPTEAAAWVTQSMSTSSENVALFEIGNEEYGSWETDNHSNPHTPTSYATNALTFMQAMKSADPNVQIGIPWGMNGSLAGGSGAPNWQTWDDTILSADAQDINWVDVHFYPFNGTPTESVQQIMATIGVIPTLAGNVHTALNKYDPSAKFVVGETNMSNAAAVWNEQPVGALFAAADTLEWLSYGAQSVDWWDIHNYGSLSGGDFGLLSSSTSEGPIDSPQPPYYGYQLASHLATQGATLSNLFLGSQASSGTLTSSGVTAPTVPGTNVYGWASKAQGGGYAVLLENASTSSSANVSVASVGLSGVSSVTSYTYDNATPSIVSATMSLSSGSITLPPESIVVLTSGEGSPPVTTTPTTTTPSNSGTTPTTTSPSNSGTTTSGTCSATMTISQWTGGFTASVTVTAGSAGTSSWSTSFTLPQGAAITNSWSATVTSSGSSVTATNASYNGTLSAGQSTTYGFQGTDSGTISAPSVSCS